MEQTQIKITIYISVHPDGARFYEWEVRGCQTAQAVKEEIIRTLEDLKKGQNIVVRAEHGPKEE